MLKLVVNNKQVPKDRDISFAKGVSKKDQEKIKFFLDFLLPGEHFVLLVEKEVAENDYAACMQHECYGNDDFFRMTLTDTLDGYEDFGRSEELAHELVHMKQYFRGELVERSDGCEWHGQHYEYPFGSEAYDPVDVMAPWELEAYGVGKALAYAWQERKDERWQEWLEEMKGSW